MARGSKIFCLRIEPSLVDEMERAIQARNSRNRLDQDTVSSWIKRAIREKLHNRERSPNYRQQLEIRCFSCDQVMSAGKPNKKRQPENVCLQCRQDMP
jgi:hypothetical protein